MYKDVKHLKKDNARLQEAYKKDLDAMRKELASKAEKEMLLDN